MLELRMHLHHVACGIGDGSGNKGHLPPPTLD
jgi:hypothetical protein